MTNWPTMISEIQLLHRPEFKKTHVDPEKGPCSKGKDPLPTRYFSGDMLVFGTIRHSNSPTYTFAWILEVYTPPATKTHH